MRAPSAGLWSRGGDKEALRSPGSRPGLHILSSFGLGCVSPFGARLWFTTKECGLERLAWGIAGYLRYAPDARNIPAQAKNGLGRGTLGSVVSIGLGHAPGSGFTFQVSRFTSVGA